MQPVHGGLYAADLAPRVGTEPGKLCPVLVVQSDLLNSEVMIDQSRAIDNRRFRRLLGRLPAPVMREVKAKLKQLAEL